MISGDLLFRDVAELKNDKNPITFFAVTNYCHNEKRFGIKEKNQGGDSISLARLIKVSLLRPKIWSS